MAIQKNYILPTPTAMPKKKVQRTPELFAITNGLAPDMEGKEFIQAAMKAAAPIEEFTPGHYQHGDVAIFKDKIYQVTDATIKRNQILALDIATKTGFATSTASGVWNLTPKKDESKGMRLIRFKTKLKEMIQTHRFKLIVFEGAAVFSKRPNFVGAEMIGVCKLTCEELGVDYMAHVPASVKKFATGNGHAGKPLMVKTAQRRWKMQSNDDNEADALALFHYTCEDLGLTEKTTII